MGDDSSFTIDGVNLHWSDILVLVAYFVIVIAFGLWVGASLFASNIGAEHFVGLAGGAAAAGVANAGFELQAIWVLVLLGWVFTPIYMASGIYTMPEYLCKRYGGQRIRIYMSVLALALSIFTKVSANLFSGAIFIRMALGWNLYLAILLLLAISAIFSMLGGLTAVVWTDFIQTVLMLAGAFVLMILTIIKMDGYTNLVKSFMAAEPNITLYDENGISCGKTPDYALHLFRSSVPGEADVPWTGLIFGTTVSTIWYWCTDQVIVQRILASKTMIYAKASSVMAGSLKYLPLFLLFIPGMASKALYPDEIGCATAEQCTKMCGSSSGCTNDAYARLVIDLMPNGLRGLMMAVMMAAVMSSLTSIFNSSATIFTIDIWTNLRKNAKDYEKLIVGRVFVLVMVGISIAWIPVIQSSQDSKLFDYIQSVTSFLAPPVCAVYLLGLFYDRTNEPGAFWTLMAGLIVGVVRFGLEIGYSVPGCGSDEEDTRPEGVKIFVDKIHFLNFGCILLGFCLVVGVLISHMTKPIDKKHLYRLTLSTLRSTEVREDLDQIKDEDEEALLEKKRKKSRASSMSSASSSHSIKKLPLWRRGLNMFCGFDTTQEQSTEVEPMYTKEEEAIMAVAFLDEKPWQSKLVNGAAVVVVSLSGFIWGFWA